MVALLPKFKPASMSLTSFTTLYVCGLTWTTLFVTADGQQECPPSRWEPQLWLDHDIHTTPPEVGEEVLAGACGPLAVHFVNAHWRRHIENASFWASWLGAHHDESGALGDVPGADAPRVYNKCGDGEWDFPLPTSLFPSCLEQCLEP